jgi:hypothetical protein
MTNETKKIISNINDVKNAYDYTLHTNIALFALQQVRGKVCFSERTRIKEN